MMLALVVATQVVEDQILSEHSRECSSSKTFDNYYRQSQNIIVEITRKLAMVTRDEVVGLNSTTKVDVIQKYLAHPLVKGMVPKYLFDLSNVQQKHEVLTIVQTCLVMHMTSSCLTKIVVAKDIVCTLISSNNLHNNKAIVRVLGVDRRNIKRGWEKRVLLSIMNETL
jgi:hypothetical protein